MPNDLSQSTRGDAAGERRPLISFISVGRTENYMGNYMWRFTTAMNYLARNLVALGRQNDAEMIVLDWNSEQPLHRSMPLVPEAREFVRFVVVPPEIAVPAQKDSKFHNAIAHNVALRRARGQYMSITDADILIPPGPLELIFQAVEGRLPMGVAPDRCFMVAHRRQVPPPRTAHGPTVEELEAFLQRSLFLLKADRLFDGLGAPAGIALMHRDLWAASRGYDERLGHWGWIDIDLHLRMSMKYPWVDLSNFGVDLLHLEHYTGPMGRNAGPPRASNGYPISRRFEANDENWGLKGVELESHASETPLDAARTAAQAAAAAQARVKPATPQTIAAEIAQESVAILVNRIVQAFGVPPREHNVMFALAWYAQTRHPRKYVELGVQVAHAAATVVAGCPTCEVYGVDQWSEDDSGGNPPAWVAANMINVAEPQAPVHLIIGPGETAIPRLCGSIDPSIFIDLALVRTEPRFGDPVANTQLLAERLTPGGAIVVSAHDPAAFNAIWETLKARQPNWTYVQFEGAPAGMVLAQPPDASSAPAVPSEPVDVMRVTLPLAGSEARETQVQTARNVRLQVVSSLRGVPVENLPLLLNGQTGQTLNTLLQFGVRDLPDTDEDRRMVASLMADIAKGPGNPQFVPCVTAAMLYRRADELSLPVDLKDIPLAMLQVYVQYLLAQPQVFTRMGELEGYYAYLKSWVDYLHDRIKAEPASDRWRQAAITFLQFNNFIPIYFSRADLKEIHTKRAEIMEYALRTLGHQIDYAPPARAKGAKRIRLGVLAAHFAPQTETFHTLPVYDHLDRSKFEIILYTLRETNSDLERYCRGRADRWVVLPGDLPSRVQRVRSDDVDLLLIGTNVGAVCNDIATMALHRMARKHVTLFSSPVTTGMPSMDCFLSGKLSEADGSQAHYREKLLLAEGPGFCFGYDAVTPPAPGVRASRKGLGIAEDAVVFASGANLYKIIPETMELWARILEAVPNSVLLLYPFGPAWSNAYAVEPFLKSVHAQLAAHGVEQQRLVALQSLNGRSDVKECLKICDVYLDSLRHAGGHSLVDPLEVGLPSVSVEGPFMRSRHGAAILRALNVPELVAADEEHYVRLAIELGKDAALRAKRRAQVEQGMKSNPPFLDRRGHSAKVQPLLESLF